MDLMDINAPAPLGPTRQSNDIFSGMDLSAPVTTRIPTQYGDFAFSVVVQRILLGEDADGRPVYTRSAHYALWPWGQSPRTMRRAIVHPEDLISDFFVSPGQEIPRKQEILKEIGSANTVLLVPSHVPPLSLQALQKWLYQNGVIKNRVPLPTLATREDGIAQPFLARLGIDPAIPIQHEELEGAVDGSHLFETQTRRTSLGMVRMSHFRDFRPLELTPIMRRVLFPKEPAEGPEAPQYWEAADHFALVFGNGLSQPVPQVRIHSTCVTGDIFGSLRCDCGPECRCAAKKFADEGGILIMQQFEGRGLPIEAKVLAYNLQQFGKRFINPRGPDIRSLPLAVPTYDTYQANHVLGYPDDMRNYEAPAEWLRQQGKLAIDLLGQNPAKRRGIEMHGIRVRRMIPITAAEHVQNENRFYADTKARKGGHKLEHALA
jgi:GTP cyclohydrolase II